ncbi:hypothetical protein N7462_010945 [Penicillium macrosclerotiorum]|uniref:uncharacterized protein n=1 Tax=Penicillium macrosclerotiorum TaxID=303699 RepID=UPI0025487DCD|nr:uncharacterized protein N7462_010945 [Penicillium macrosclerotiorum]KAJ5669875.1 hypothetical protein N7462_010945 [Penicillium macrosclerotiorum]
MASPWNREKRYDVFQYDYVEDPDAHPPQPRATFLFVRTFNPAPRGVSPENEAQEKTQESTDESNDGKDIDKKPNAGNSRGFLFLLLRHPKDPKRFIVVRRKKKVTIGSKTEKPLEGYPEAMPRLFNTSKEDRRDPKNLKDKERVMNDITRHQARPQGTRWRRLLNRTIWGVQNIRRIWEQGESHWSKPQRIGTVTEDNLRKWESSWLHDDKDNSGRADTARLRFVQDKLYAIHYADHYAEKQPPFTKSSEEVTWVLYHLQKRNFIKLSEDLKMRVNHMVMVREQQKRHEEEEQQKRHEEEEQQKRHEEEEQQKRHEEEKQQKRHKEEEQQKLEFREVEEEIRAGAVGFNKAEMEDPTAGALGINESSTGPTSQGAG